MNERILLRLIADVQKKADKLPECQWSLRDYEKYVIAREMLDALAIEMEQEMPAASHALTQLVNSFMKA